MTPLDEQFEILKTEFPAAELQRLADGSHLISVPAIVLPVGWSKKEVGVKFLAPVGYPFSRPDCFWTDPDLRLASGAAPQNTGPNPIPHSGLTVLWFSWHVASWNPNCDSLLTYLHVVQRRLQNLQ